MLTIQLCDLWILQQIHCEQSRLDLRRYLAQLFRLCGTSHPYDCRETDSGA